MFGVPLTTEMNALQDSLVPSLPRSLQRLKLASDVFDAGQFDPALKQRLLAAIMCYTKSDKNLKDSSRWNANPNAHTLCNICMQISGYGIKLQHN